MAIVAQSRSSLYRYLFLGAFDLCNLGGILDGAILACIVHHVR